MLTARTSSRRKARASISDMARVLAASLGFLLLALARRALGQRGRPAWSSRLEMLIAAYRGSWSVMPGLGIVRWRNVGEVMSPLQTAGLVPRYVQHGLGSGEIEGAWLEPPDSDGPVLLYFHGGGFCFGSLRTHGNLIGALARASRARTFAVEYRLAPEQPSPAALDDAWTAYRYLLAQQIPATRIVLGGDSAGGTLVLQLLLALRDRGEPMPAGGVALSPWVDLGCSGASFRTNAAFDFVGIEHCRLAAAHYVAGGNPAHPDISPLFAHLQGLPPLLVHAGEAEVLVDQIRSFVERAQAAGVDVQFSLYPDMVHVWHMLRSATAEAQRAIDEVGAFVRKHSR